LLMFLKYDDIKNRLSRIKKGHWSPFLVYFVA
jgi:hypothetical protein